MMYILLLIYFVNIVTGDDSSESKYIDLLPEKEKEDFLETIARRIFDNFKHKNAIPERDEHTKLIEQVLKEESLNLKRVSQNTSDSDGKGNVAGDDGDALDLAREGKRNKRNSLNGNKNSDIAGVQRASKETNKSNFNELSKELGASDTEDIEVKHTNNKQTEVNKEEINTKSNIEVIGTENTVRDLISKVNSSERDGESNHEQERNTTKSPPSTYKPEKTKDTNEEASESIETTKTLEHSYSPTEKINVTSRRNGNSKPNNDSVENDTKQEPVTITVKTSLSASPDVMFTETTSEALLEKKTENKDKTNTIMTISPKTEATGAITELSKINETRKAYDKLASIFYTEANDKDFSTDDIRDDRENQDTKAGTNDKTLISKTDVTAINVKLDEKYFDGESTAATVDKNQNHISLNDSTTSIKDNYKPVTEKINSKNSFTDSENKDTKSSETIVNSTESSNETIIRVIKNSKDYIKKKHSMKQSANTDYNGTTLGNNTSPMAQSSNVIVKRNPDITTTTMDTLINNNNEINIVKGPEKKQNINIRITDVTQTEANMQSNKVTNSLEIGKTTNKEILVHKDVEIETKNNTVTVLEINNNKTEANNEQVITESINITIIYDNTTEKTISNSSKIRAKIIVFENNATENNKSKTSETYIETTTVKIETLTVATDLNKTEAKDKHFRIEDTKPYYNQDTLLQTPIPNTHQESVIFFDNDDSKIAKNLQKMEKISANFVNDMIKVIRASFSDKPNEDLKPLRSLDENPKPKEYKVYKALNNEPYEQNNGAKDDNVMEENPYYVPVYNYGPEHAYYNPKNRLGPNADDDDITIIKNDGLNVESIAHDYDSIVKDNGYNENDNLKSYYQNRQDLNDNDARNDVDYDEAYNKERDFIDRMGDIKRNYIFSPNENLRGRDAENTQKLKKVEYMKNLVKIYKNRNGKNNNRKRSFSKYKLNLPIVLKYPKYSDIIMNSHDYLDVDYRYPTWNKPKHTRYRKHRILRGNGNNVIITRFADDPNSDQEDIIGVSNPTTDNKYKDDSFMLSDETQNQETENPFKVIYDDDYENYIKKPLQDHSGKPNSMNLFESGEYVWAQDTKEKRNKKKMEHDKSFGVKNQIRKIREMMYSTANFGFIEQKKVEEKSFNGLDFIKEAPKMCDGEDESCVEPFVLISNNHLHPKKPTDSARHAMNNIIPSDNFIARTNNTSDFVVDYVPKLSARSINFKFDNAKNIHIRDHIQIKWITDFSEIHDSEAKSDCSFCSNSVCHSCVCGISLKFCKKPDTRPSDDDNNNDHHHHDNDKDEHHNHHHNNDNDEHHHDHNNNDNEEHHHEDHNNDNDVDMAPANDDTEQTEEPKDEDIPNTTVGWHWDTVKNISMLPSYLDPILAKNHEHGQKENLKKYKKYHKKYLPIRSRNDKLPPKTSVRADDKSLEHNSTESQETKPNIIIKHDTHHHDGQNEISNPDISDRIEEYDTTDTKTDEKSDTTSQSSIKTYNKIKKLKSIIEIIPDDVEIMLKVADMLDNQNSKEEKTDTRQKECKDKEYLRSIDSTDLESYVSVLQDMVRNEARGLVQYDWMGTSIDIQAAIFKLKEMIESVKNNEVLDQLDFKLLKYFTFLHKFSMKRQKDLRMFLPKPKYKYNRTRSQKGVYSRTWLKRRLKKFAFEVSGTDLYYFVDFLDDLQFYLYDLHTALTQIAMVTRYKNQNWFKNLTELYLDNSRKNILELLLHVTTVRLLDLVENNIQTGLQDGFLRYVINNEKEIEKSKNELVLIINIIEELKKSE